MKPITAAALLLAITSLLACSSRTTLDRSKVLSLLGDKKEEVKSSIKSAPMMLYVDKYLKLAQAGIISCERGAFVCNPGPNGKELSPVTSTGLVTFTVGYLTPKEVTGITKSTETDAVAEVVMAFEITSDFYKKNKALLDPVMEVNGGGPHIKLGDKTAKVRLKLYDDGWRVVDKRW